MDFERLFNTVTRRDWINIISPRVLDIILMKMYAELIWIKNIRSYDKKLNDNKLTGGDSSNNLAGLARIFNKPLS